MPLLRIFFCLVDLWHKDYEWSVRQSIMDEERCLLKRVCLPLNWFHTFRSKKAQQFWSPAYQDNRSTELLRGEWSNHDPMGFSIFLKDNNNTLCLIHLCLLGYVSGNLQITAPYHNDWRAICTTKMGVLIGQKAEFYSVAFSLKK